ncbi:MAG: Ig-like domain-containing protein, partial [Defluviitaleaceae bacterium]|nr:Ig-like domain-containing protein [Defluviitaleaceae bacterium]
LPDIHGGPNLTGTQLIFGEWEGKPIVWIVIDVDEETGTATLWAKDKVANMSYHIFGNGNHAYWKGSYLCAWLNATKWNSMVTGELLRDFTETGFLKNAFSEAERAVILPEYGTEFEPVPYFNQYTGEQLTDYIDTRQAVVLPSIDELGSWCTIGSWDIDVRHRASGSHTWLRTPADFSKFRPDDVYDPITFKYVWYMNPNGTVSRDGIRLQAPLGAEYDIRPAIKINLSYLRSHAAFATSVVFGGGKHPRAGGVLKDGSYFEASMSGGVVQEVAALEGNLFKLTLFSTAVGDVAIADTSPRAVLPGQTVSVAFSNATVGESRYVSCILTDGSGAVKYYSRLSQAASGTADINLPRDMPAGEYTIGIFCEKYNGEFKFDECGAIADIPLTVKARPCQIELREPQLIGFGGKLWNVIGWDGAKVSSDGNTATLLLSGESRLAGNHYGFSRFNANEDDVVYSGSELQGAMEAAYNSLGAGERALVAGRTLEGAPYADTFPYLKHVAGPDVTGAKFWPLNMDEEMTLEIGETLFGVDESFIDYTTRPRQKEMRWWGRAPADTKYVICGITGSNYNRSGGIWSEIVTEEFYVRPAFNLSLSRILFATPAENGKPAGAGGGLVPIEDSYAIKYTAIDRSLTLNSSDTSARAVGTGGGTVNIAYSGLNGGYVSCVIADSAGKALYYGKLSAAAGGTAAVSVPALPEGRYTILLFSETDNGGCYTDFCSEPVYIPLTAGSPAANAGPPAVTSVSSDAGAAANPDGGYLRIAFNKAMGAAGTVCLDGMELTAAGKWTGNTYSVQYPALEHGRTYHVTVYGFRDASGAEMLPDNSGSLTTAPFSLSDVVSFAGQEWWVVGYSSRDEETLSKHLGHGGSTLYRYSRTGLYSHGTDNITLLLKGGVPYGNTAFGNSLDYAGSLLRGKLEEIANDYGAREQALIRGRTLTAGSAAIHGADAPDQKLWPLLAWEYIHPIGDSFPYGKKDTPSSFGGAMYLTRSGNGKPTKSAAVSSGSAGYDYAEIFDLEFNQPAGIRPVLVLDLSSVFLTNAAQGARAKPGGLSLSPYIRPERVDHYWSYGYEVRPLKDTMKFTMIDSGLTLSANTAPINAVAGGTVSIPYTNASAGANRTVSCVITDFYGEVKYYGKLADCSATASGTAGFTVPAFDEGRYTVKLFCEEANGAFDLDFCSEPVCVTMNVGGTPPAAVSLTPSGAGVAASGNIAVAFNKNMDITSVGTVTINGQPLTGGEWLDKRNFVVPYAVAANTACAVTVSGFRDEFGTEAAAVSNSFSTFAYSFAVYDTVVYAGQEWWVIGSGGKGVYPGANTATLLLKHDGWEIPPPFGTAATVTNYSGSELQTAMETVANGFPLKELARINARTLTAASDGISGPDAANQKLWPLSADEYLATAYWDISTFGMYEYTETVSGVLFRLKRGYVYPLRTQEEFVTTWEAPYYTNYHYGAGHISSYFDPINVIINGIKYVRPAFQLDLSDVWFATDANGKPAGVESGFLTAVAPLSGAPVKFTMFDCGLTLTCTDTAKRNTYASGSVTIGYSGANGHFVSCVIVDENGAVKYYGKLSAAAGGTARLVLPEELPEGDYTIKLFSEEVNGANCTDFAGAPVDIALTVDNTPISVAYVDASGGDDSNDGVSWETAFATLQMALNRIAEPGQIYVAAGTYYPAKTAGDGTDPRDKAFVIPKDVKICGGYDASTGERHIRLNETVLSGDIGVKADDSDNSYHVVISSGDVGSALLDGFTITGGNADGSGNISLDGFVTGIGR